MSCLNPLRKDIEKNPEFFYVLGSFEGDGHYNKRGKVVNINVIDFDFLEEIKRIFNKYSPETRIKIIPHTKAINNSKAQKRINLCCAEFFNRGYHKLSPKTKEEKRYYLKGLFDAEGSIGITTKKSKKCGNGKFYYCRDKWFTLAQKDISKLNLWASWLNEFEIQTNKIYRNDGRSHISIRKNNSIKNYFKEIGFSIKRKQRKLKEVINNLQTSNLSEKEEKKVIEIYLRTNFSATLIGKMFNRTKFAIIRRLKFRNLWVNKSLKKISANDIDIAESILGKELDFKIPNRLLLKYDIKNIKTSKIKSITFSKEEEAVDLETPKYHNFFLNNGILSHNSVFAQQIGKYLTEKVNEEYKINNEFTLNNICFKGEDLIEKSFEVPKYSVIILDEGDDLVEHYWSKLAKNLRRFFRKCGQLNLFLILIIPDFFELPRPYALTRSICLMDVHFYGKFQRGFFKFYNFKRKRELYLKGKKLANYDAVGDNFEGRFANTYTVPEQEYRKRKQKDLEEQELKEKSPSEIIRETKIDLFKKVYANIEIKTKRLSQIFGISNRTGYNWVNDGK